MLQRQKSGENVAQMAQCRGCIDPPAPAAKRLRRGIRGLRVNLGSPAFVAAMIIAMAVAMQPVPPVAQESNAVTLAVERLIAAYPDHLAGAAGNEIVWQDGSRMTIDDGRGAKSHAERLEAPDLKDMFMQPYPRGATGIPPSFEIDPGRARNAAFFDKVYGNCARQEVEKSLVDVVWLPKKWGKTVRVTRINGAAQKLSEVSRELDALPAQFDTFLAPTAGTYNCRPIAGTSRTSAHGYGIAIDLAVARSHYWRWQKPGDDGRYIHKNSFPMAIVEVFERHGFIWGGKWYHYDTMHFEYRPELLAP